MIRPPSIATRTATPFPVTTLFRSGDYKTDRTWNVAGRQGSESDTIFATDLFVPTHRVYLMSNGMVGNRLAGQVCNGEVTDRWPVFPLLRDRKSTRLNSSH